MERVAPENAFHDRIGKKILDTLAQRCAAPH